MISIFAPFNNTRYLTEAWHSIQRQNFADFEWVLVPNGNCGELPDFEDNRVRVVPYTHDNHGVGALKRFACDHCRGDSFLELDHDDLLVPGTLPLVADAISKGDGFVYSDAAVFEPDLLSYGYAASHGWETYPFKVYGQTFTATKCFDLHPRMLSEIYYAPDHLRCWSRKAYYQAGGHDPNLEVGDDHDLICRTYLTGLPFKHIGRCGYLYRRHGDNTTDKRQEQIQRQNRLNQLKYFIPLTEEWCRRKKLEILKPAKDGKLQYAGSEVRYGMIKAHYILQMIRPEDQIAFFNDCYTRLVPGGFLSVVVPSENGRYASMSPRHVMRFNPNSFLGYTNKVFAENLGGVECRYQQALVEEFYPSNEMLSLKMLCLRTELMALGDDRVPGLVEI